MNELFTAIYNELTTVNSLNTAVGGRIYLGFAPQRSSFPFCVFDSVVGVTEEDFGEERSDFLIQFDIFSQKNSADEAGDVLGYLKTLMDNASLTVTGWSQVTFSRGNEYRNNDFTQTPPVHGYSIEYNCIIEKTK